MGLIRTILALVVVIVHAGPLFGLGFTQSVGGKVAVQLFYTISGFYMALVLTEKYRGPGALRTFFANRLLRLYPAYLCIALLTLGVGGLLVMVTGAPIRPFGSWARQVNSLDGPTIATLVLANLSLIGQDLTMFFRVDEATAALAFNPGASQDPLVHRFMLVPQCWTIGVELWFYSLAPFLVRLSTLRLAGISVALLAFRYWLINGAGLAEMPWDYCFFPCELPLFLFGTLAYRAYRTLDWDRPWQPACAWLAFAVALVLIVFYQYVPWGRLGPDFFHALRLSPLSFVFPVLLPWVFHRTKRQPVDRFVGELSYPIYVCHNVLIDLLVVLGSQWVAENLGALACLSSVGCSVLIWWLVDSRIERWRRRPAPARTVPVEVEAIPCALPS